VLQVTAVVELVWQDETGDTALTILRAPSSWTVAEIGAFAEAEALFFVPLSDCTLVGYRIRYKSAFNDPVLLADGSPITKTGVFFFETADDAPDSLIVIPAIKDSILVASGPTAGYAIDLTNSDVIAFTDAVIAGGVSNPFADVFTAVLAAYVQSRV